MLKAWGVQTVIVSETLDRRRELARKFGADYIIDPLENEDGADPVVAEVMAVFGNLGGGADVAFEATDSDCLCQNCQCLDPGETRDA